jgi:histidinol-phosphatase (PHP family)
MTDSQVAVPGPADSHVHTEWSWDAQDGSMERSCARAVEIGLPAIAFTEHVDHTVWTVDLDAIAGDDHLASLTTPDGSLTPPDFDAVGYLEAIDECRRRYPDLRILSGLELGEPHWHEASIAKILATGTFDRVLGSLHCLPIGDGYAEPPGLYAHRPAAKVVREYLAELPRLVGLSDDFAVVAHIDYPIRYWPQHEGRFDPADFEEDFRHALRSIAATGRALEINTRIPLHSLLLRWWYEEGGDAVTFGSDAHEPSAIAHGFRDATDLAAACGFRPGRSPYDFWGRVD